MTKYWYRNLLRYYKNNIPITNTILFFPKSLPCHCRGQPKTAPARQKGPFVSGWDWWDTMDGLGGAIDDRKKNLLKSKS